jgi:hypothetical protein
VLGCEVSQNQEKTAELVLWLWVGFNSGATKGWIDDADV